MYNACLDHQVNKKLLEQLHLLKLQKHIYVDHWVIIRSNHTSVYRCTCPIYKIFHKTCFVRKLKLAAIIPIHNNWVLFCSLWHEWKYLCVGFIFYSFDMIQAFVLCVVIYSLYIYNINNLVISVSVNTGKITEGPTTLFLQIPMYCCSLIKQPQNWSLSGLNGNCRWPLLSKFYFIITLP